MIMTIKLNVQTFPCRTVTISCLEFKKNSDIENKNFFFLRVVLIKYRSFQVTVSSFSSLNLNYTNHLFFLFLMYSLSACPLLFMHASLSLSLAVTPSTDVSPLTIASVLPPSSPSFLTCTCDHRVTFPLQSRLPP